MGFRWACPLLATAAVVALLVPGQALAYENLASVDKDWTDSARQYFANEAVHVGLAPNAAAVVSGPADGKLVAGATPDTTAITGIDSQHRCEVGLTPKGAAEKGDVLEETLAHEVFHCVSILVSGVDPDTSPAEQAKYNWAWEGLAVWVGLTEVSSRASVDASHLAYYFAQPNGNVLDSSYSAVGFWGQVEETYHNLWGRMKKVLQLSATGQETAAFDAAGGNGTEFLERWGASIFDDPARGAVFTQHSPISIDPSADEAPPKALSYPKDLQFQTKTPYAPRRYQIAFSSHRPVVELMLDQGHGTIQTKDNPTDLSDRWFCERGHSCACRGGSTPLSDELSELPDGAALGIASNADITHGDVEFFTLAQYCQDELTVEGASGKTETAFQDGKCSILHDSQGGYYTEDLGFLFASENPLTHSGSGISSSELDLSTIFGPSLGDGAGIYNDWTDDQLMQMGTNPLPREYDPQLTAFINYGKDFSETTYYGLVTDQDFMHLNPDLKSGTMKMDFVDADGGSVTISGGFQCKFDPGSVRP